MIAPILKSAMPRNTSLQEKRNQFIRERFRYHRKRNPKWSIMAVIETVAGEVWLSEITVVKILKQSAELKVPTAPTVSKYIREKERTFL